MMFVSAAGQLVLCLIRSLNPNSFRYSSKALTAKAR
jgi:hypothetical protein